MKKMMNNKNIIIMILCITIIFMGIGFTYLSLKLKDKNAEQNIFDVSFTKVQNNNSVKGGKIAPTGTSTIMNQGKSLDINLNMNTPYDELAYTITIKNKGTISAEIIDIIESPNYSELSKQNPTIYPVTITYNDIIGTVLEPKESIELKVTAIYNKTTTSSEPKKISYKLNIISATPKED